MELIKVDDYVKAICAKYPIMHHPKMIVGGSHEFAKFSVLEHLFNSIGNGEPDEFDNLNDFPFSFQEINSDKDSLNYLLRKYEAIDKGQKVFNASYFAPKKIGNITIEGSPIYIGILGSEIDLYNNKDLFWTECKSHEKIKNFYPNDKEKYSAAYSMIKHGVFNNEWLEEIIWIYQEYLEYLQNPENEFKLTTNNEYKENDPVAEMLAQINSKPRPTRKDIVFNTYKDVFVRYDSLDDIADDFLLDLSDFSINFSNPSVEDVCDFAHRLYRLRTDEKINFAKRMINLAKENIK